MTGNEPEVDRIVVGIFANKLYPIGGFVDLRDSQFWKCELLLYLLFKRMALVDEDFSPVFY